MKLLDMKKGDIAKYGDLTMVFINNNDYMMIMPDQKIVRTNKYNVRHNMLLQKITVFELNDAMNKVVHNNNTKSLLNAEQIRTQFLQLKDN